MITTEINQHVKANMFLCLITRTHRRLEATPRVVFNTRKNSVMVICSRRFIPDKQPRYPLGFEVGSTSGRREMTKLKFSVFTGFPAHKVITKFTDITETLKWILNVKIVVDSTSRQKYSFVIKPQVLMLSNKS